MRKAALGLAVGVISALAPPASGSSVPGTASCPMFPVDNVWHADVSGLPIHPMSNTYVAAIGTTAQAKADFGSGAWDGGPIGIPYNVVGAGQPTTSVTFDYDEDSDHVPYPIPANASIEGGPGSSGDRHVIIVDHSTCTLYELYAAYPNDDGTWRAGSGAVWDLNSNALRPETWTSGDAAGLPILPGLVRYDEVASGHIDHAIRVTVPHSDRSYVWPARHQAGVSNPSLPPMGLRLRLKPDVEVSSYPRDDQVILQAMKTYGVIVADNGSPWFISGVPDERWNNDVLQQLRNIRGSDFEAVDESALMVDGDSGQAAGAAPGPPLPSAAQTGKPSQGSPAQASDTSPAAAAADPAPSTTSDPVTTTSAPSPNETAAHQPDVTVRARDRASRKGWPWIVAAIAAIVVLIGCGAAGARVRRRSGRETAESVVDHDSVAGPAGLEHSFAVARAPDRDGELVAGEHR